MDRKLDSVTMELNGRWLGFPRLFQCAGEFCLDGSKMEDLSLQREPTIDWSNCMVEVRSNPIHSLWDGLLETYNACENFKMHGYQGKNYIRPFTN